MTRRPVRLLALGCLAALLPLTGPVPGSQAGQGGPVAPVTPADRATASTGLRSAFDSDTEGWVADHPGDPVTWVGVGGNPGGSMSVQGGSNAIAALRTPASWAGSRTELLGGRLSFDLRLGPGVRSAGSIELGLVAIDGRTLFRPVPGLVGEIPAWTSVTAPITDDGSWSLSGSPTPAGAAEFDAVLSQLAHVYVASFLNRSTDTMYLDNVVLASKVTRRLTLAREGSRFHGRLKPGGSCAGGQRVSVQRVRPGPDAVVGTTRTDMVGEFAVPSRNPAPGTYYARTDARFVEGGGDCSAARSANLRVR